MARKVHHIQEGVAYAAHALANGAERESFSRVRWDVAGSCANPRYVEVEGRPTAPEREQGGSLVVTGIETRCRRCEPCRKARSQTWTYRAQAEMAGAWRTWFGTLTLRPEEHYRMLCAARLRLEAAGVSFETLSQEEQFKERHNQICRELTLWFKRVRKASGAKLRYILVAEAHKSGLPHYHCLIHEVTEHGQVRHKTLSEQWSLGFTNFKLVDEHPKAARYVCKYLSKAVEARVRASLRYGQNDLKSQQPGGAACNIDPSPKPIF